MEDKLRKINMPNLQVRESLQVTHILLHKKLEKVAKLVAEPYPAIRVKL